MKNFELIKAFLKVNLLDIMAKQLIVITKLSKPFNPINICLFTVLDNELLS